MADLADQCHYAPLRRSTSLRFIVAYLYRQSGERDRYVYDEFWRCIQDPYERSTCNEQARYFRHRDTTSSLKAMVRIAGFPQTPQFMQQLRDSRLRPPDASEGDMCNHYRNKPEMIPSWRDYIGAKQSETYSGIEAGVWPKRKAIIVREDASKGRILDVMSWGFAWQRAGKKPGTFVQENTTNVRNLNSNLWNNSINIAAYRCLVPFNSFAEPKPEAGREEIWFKVNDAPVSAFAGIWRPGNAERGNMFAFLTCEPNPLVKPIHPKAMPVILHPEDYGRWLGGETAEKMATPFPGQLMAIQ